MVKARLLLTSSMISSQLSIEFVRLAVWIRLSGFDYSRLMVFEPPSDSDNPPSDSDSDVMSKPSKGSEKPNDDTKLMRLVHKMQDLKDSIASPDIPLGDAIVNNTYAQTFLKCCCSNDRSIYQY